MKFVSGLKRLIVRPRRVRWHVACGMAWSHSAVSWCRRRCPLQNSRRVSRAAEVGDNRGRPVLFLLASVTVCTLIRLPAILLRGQCHRGWGGKVHRKNPWKVIEYMRGFKMMRTVHWSNGQVHCVCVCVHVSLSHVNLISFYEEGSGSGKRITVSS